MPSATPNGLETGWKPVTKLCPLDRTLQGPSAAPPVTTPPEKENPQVSAWDWLIKTLGRQRPNSLDSAQSKVHPLSTTQGTSAVVW